MKKTTRDTVFGILKGVLLAAVGGFIVFVGSIYCYLGLVPLYVGRVFPIVAGGLVLCAALAVSRLLPEVPQGAETAAYLTESNAHPLRLVLVAEIADTPAGCGLLELEGTPRVQTAVEEAFRSPELEQLLRDSLAAVAAQKGVEL